MSEYIGLKPKMYSYDKYKSKEEIEEEKTIKAKEDSKKKKKKEAEDKTTNKAKGVPMCKVKQLTIGVYRSTLYKNDRTRINFNSIRSYNHTIYIINCNKIGLSSYDNKRYWIDKVNSLAYGHWRATYETINSS
jgi:hypothetical protein